MEPISTGIAIGLGVHLGKKAIDKLWNAISQEKSPIIDGSGNLTAVASGRRTIVPHGFTTTSPSFAHVIGEIYLPANVAQFLSGDEIALVLVVEETGGETLLFQADIESGYEIDLPFGIYSFFVFLVDGAAESFYSARLHAIGFPSRIDLSDATEFSLDDEDDIWDLVVDTPLGFSPENDSYLMNFILVESSMLPGQPEFVEDLDNALRTDFTGAIFGNLTGSWVLDEQYEFGSTAADVFLLHVDDTLSGIAVIHDTMEDGTELILRVLSASVRRAKKLFKASSQRQGGRVSGVHPAVQDRSKISWV